MSQNSTSFHPIVLIQSLTTSVVDLAFDVSIVTDETVVATPLRSVALTEGDRTGTSDKEPNP